MEVSHSRTNMPRLNWALSRVKVEPVTEQAAKAVAELLEGDGLHGHKYAVDATVAEVALRQPKPVAVLTSDSDDMTQICATKSASSLSDPPAHPEHTPWQGPPYRRPRAPSVPSRADNSGQIRLPETRSRTPANPKSQVRSPATT